jgi:hypothetical protein
MIYHIQRIKENDSHFSRIFLFIFEYTYFVLLCWVGHLQEFLQYIKYIIVEFTPSISRIFF